MNEVLNYALISAINISGCDAGCLLKISAGKREILTSYEYSTSLKKNYTEIILKSFDEESLTLIATKGRRSDKLLPAVSFCRQLIKDETNGTGIFFILINVKPKTLKPTDKKILRIITDTLSNFCSSNKEIASNLKAKSEEADTSPFNHLSEDLVFILDTNGKFIDVNINGAILLGYSTEELLNLHLIDLIPTHQIESFTKYFNTLIKYNSTNPFNTKFTKMSGEEINIQLRCKMIFEDGALNLVYGIAKKNIADSRKDEINFLKNKLLETERILKIERMRVHQQKAVLEELNRMKNDFISNISHEFRTPLASIIGFSETIDSESDINEEMREEFNREILNEAKRLAKLINEVLDTSRVAGKKILLNKTPFDIVNLMKEIINEQTSVMKEKNLILNPDLPLIETIVYADRNKISDAVSALLQYSISSSSEKGRISVMLSDFDEEIELIISDTGLGISETIKNKVLESEHSVSKENFTSEPVHSLVFTKQIVDLHGGLFTFESELNGGTSFVIKLPRIKYLQQS